MTIFFLFATLGLAGYGVKNRRYLGYRCTIQEHFQLGLIAWVVLGTIVLFSYVWNRPLPPPC